MTTIEPVITQNEIEPLPYAYADLQPVFPKRKVMKALPIFVSIFCREYEDAANLVNHFLSEVEDNYEMISAITTPISGDWEYIIDGEIYLFRWRTLTVATIRTLKGDFAYVKHNIINTEVIDYIRMNHTRGVYFF